MHFSEIKALISRTRHGNSGSQAQHWISCCEDGSTSQSTRSFLSQMMWSCEACTLHLSGSPKQFRAWCRLFLGASRRPVHNALIELPWILLCEPTQPIEHRPTSKSATVYAACRANSEPMGRGLAAHQATPTPYLELVHGCALWQITFVEAHRRRLHQLRVI